MQVIEANQGIDSAGGLMVVLVFLSMLNPAVRAMEEGPAGGALPEGQAAS